VLDYVAGPALDEVLEWLQEHGEKLGDDASCYLAAQVLHALASAHAMADENGQKTPVLHRGLNPRASAFRFEA
jgi:serine/threonine protein kinase